MPGITEQNYEIMAKAYADAALCCFMITPDMALHRSAWNAYWRVKGMGRPSTPGHRPQRSVMKMMFEKHGKYAVPCEWPWMFDQSIDQEMLGGYADADEVARHRSVGRPFNNFARSETAASANEWLRKAKVDHLPQDHPDRRKALAEWGRWFQRQPNPDAYKNMAERDPNRRGAPPGWKGVM